MTLPVTVNVNPELRQVERIITRPDGRRVRFLTHDFTSPFSRAPELVTDVFLDTEGGWALQSTAPRHPGKRLPPGMRVADYVANGRPPAFAAAGVGPFLKATQEARRILYGY